MRLEVPAQLLMVYLLVHLRFVGMLFTSPMFLATGMPMPFRYLCVVLLTLASVGTVESELIPMILFDSWVSISILAVRELLVGVAIGLLAELPLVALQVAGEQVGTAIGISMASVMDPLSQRQTSIVAQLHFLVGLWFYFRWNGHLLMVQSVVESLRLIPIAKLSLVPSGDMALGKWISSVFSLAIRIAIPYYCALLLADIGLGFLARTVPQMNIFVLGLPMKLMLGFFALMVVLPLAVDTIYNQVHPWIEFALASATAWK
jgi:flagellar biosynthetic protein FliR